MIIATDATEKFPLAESPANNTGPFVIDLAKKPNLFRELEGAVFDVSSRFVIPDVNILNYLKIYFMYLNQNQIGTVYGNVVYPSKLYGGRPYNLEHSMTDRHVRQLYDANIGVSLTLTNHFFESQIYDDNSDFLERFHRQGNTIVCTNDELAKRIRSDFPQYKLKASLIKHLNIRKKVEKALEVYDYIVIPMDKNDDAEFLEVLPEKGRIYLFGNATCAYNCPSRSCYVGFSQLNSHQVQTSRCSILAKDRTDHGFIFFDVGAFRDMGYHRFKMVPNLSSGPQKALKALTAMQSIPVKTKNSALSHSLKPIAVVYSYPKCGRTWLRFILASYINRLCNLGLPINFQSIFTLLPNHDSDALKGMENFQFSGHKQVPLISFSHQKRAVDKVADESRVLLLRSIPDVVVSDFFQRSKLLKSYEGSLAQFIRDRNGALTQYLEYLNQWAELMNDNTLVLTYEALTQNTHSEVARLLSFLGLENNTRLLAEAIGDSSFEQMAAIEKSLGIAGFPTSHHKDPEARRVRKGKIDGYTDYLSAEDIAYCRQQALLTLSPKAQSWLAKIGLGDFIKQST